MKWLFQWNMNLHTKERITIVPIVLCVQKLVRTSHGALGYNDGLFHVIFAKIFNFKEIKENIVS